MELCVNDKGQWLKIKHTHTHTHTTLEVSSPIMKHLDGFILFNNKAEPASRSAMHNKIKLSPEDVTALC